MSFYEANATEADILKLLQSGDNSGYELLYDRYGATLYGVIVRIVKSTEDAENLLQDCFVKIWRKIDTYDTSKGKLITWLLNIARNTAIDFTRSRVYAHRQKNQSIENIVSPSIEISEAPQPIETIGVKDALHILSPHHRQVIEWMYFEGYTQQEIADEFDIPLGTVKTRTRMAMNELRAHFGLV